MRLKATSIAVVVVIAALLSPGGGLAQLTAQSLADVARKEQERRQAIKETAKVLTNKDLGAVPAVAEPAATTPAPAAGGMTPEAGKAAAKADSAKADAGKTDPAKDQAYWSGAWKELQTRIARNETFAIALQSLVNAKQTEHDNAGDGVRQNAIVAERQKLIDDLNRLKKEIEDDKKATATLQEDARRAGVPPGWLR